MEDKIEKHAGFIIEALVEAFPQAILQMVAIGLSCLYSVSSRTMRLCLSDSGVRGGERAVDRLYSAVDAEHGVQVVRVQHRLRHHAQAAGTVYFL